jgi:2-haloacid dehalogenase
MLDFSRFKVLTFDCYGTLIDWESGIVAALRPVFAAHRINVNEDELLARYARHETEVEAGPYRRYRDVLAEIVVRLGKEYGFTPTDNEQRSLAESIRNWQPFPDTVSALQRLASRYSLVIVSNIDDDLFALTQPKLGVNFADAITAQQVGSYKPSPRNFEVVLQRISGDKEQVLHVAQSLFHDVAPARALGIATAWINRRMDKEGTGATPPSSAQPDVTFATLAELATAAGFN